MVWNLPLYSTAQMFPLVQVSASSGFKGVIFREGE